MALLFQGIASRLTGNLASAIDILTPLSASCPDAPLVHLQLGLALRESGQNEAAVRSMRRAVAVKPDFSDAWLALADLLTALGDRDAADDAFTMYVRYSANDPAPAGACCCTWREPRCGSRNPVAQQVEQHPTDIVALCLLADVVERHDRMKEAEALLKRCLDLAPGYKRARHNTPLYCCARTRFLNPYRNPAGCWRMSRTIRTCVS